MKRIKIAENVEVIRVLVAEGEGTDSSPVKLVEQYWGKNGHYIGKVDPSESQEMEVNSFACE